MKTTFAALAAVLCSSSVALAQTAESEPFYLVATGGKYSNNSFTPCHEGAAIEGLCIGDVVSSSSYTYNFNTSNNQVVQNTTLGPTGLLTYLLPSEPIEESEPLAFYFEPSTNVYLPLFEPTQGTQVAFDVNEELHIQAYVDDTVTPPKSVAVYGLYNWYVCETYYEGYIYETLAWVVGENNPTPQNPSCVKVSVFRQFVQY